MLKHFKAWRWPLIVGLAGWLAVVLTRSDPGLTSDEPFSVFYGKDYVTRFCERGREFFSPESINETFDSRREHPPLGRWAIGWVHWLLDEHRQDATYVNIYAARVAPATAFALMLVLLTRVVGSRHGEFAGVAAGVALVLMPRAFGHAHFAALDTFVSCTYLIAVLSAAWMMEGRWPSLRAPLAGIALGAALLTKMHGGFLIPIVWLWGVCSHRFRGLPALLIWSFTGAAVFFIGWPWLWGDLTKLWSEVSTGTFQLHQLPHTLDRLSLFLMSSLDRQTIHVTYLGRTYADWAVPWHYSWLMFAVTVPAGLLVIGLCGLVRLLVSVRSDPRGQLYLVALLFPLVVFSMPRVPVYDGVRMFLMVFPLWAIMVGRGAGLFAEWLERLCRPRWAIAAVAGVLACQACGVIYYHPFQLSYYNLLVGGLGGAERRGFEVTYWGDAVTPSLVNEWSQLAPEESCAVVVPSLYDAHPELFETELTSRRHQQLRGSLESKCPYLIVFNRKAYLDGVRDIIDSPDSIPLAETSKAGVWLSRVYVRRLPGAANNNDDP